jgi:hypothetical protein
MIFNKSNNNETINLGVIKHPAMNVPNQQMPAYKTDQDMSIIDMES